jgi:hypothetical protein
VNEDKKNIVSGAGPKRRIRPLSQAVEVYYNKTTMGSNLTRKRFEAGFSRILKRM